MRPGDAVTRAVVFAFRVAVGLLVLAAMCCTFGGW